MAQDNFIDPSFDSSRENNAELVEHQLAKILDSYHFKSAKQMQNFLRYVVRKTLAGKGSTLKQYTIAVEALGFPVDFDSDTNPVVRIKAGRVRERLAKYYEDEGENDALVITIPKGSYAPTFETKARAKILPKVSKRLSQSPKIAVMCFSDETQSKESNRLLFQITDVIAKELSKFLFLRLVVSIPHADKSNASFAATEIRDKFSADYMLVFYIQQLPEEKFMLVCRLAESETEEILWSESFDVDAGQAFSEQYKTIGQITAVTGDIQQSILHRHWTEKLLEDEINTSEVFKVLAYYQYYSNDLSMATFSKVANICEKKLKDTPDDVIANVLYAELCRRDYVYGFGVIDSPLKRGESAALNAVRLRPDSHETHFVLGQILFYLGRHRRSLSELTMARDICQYHVYVGYGVGLHFCLMGEWKEGYLLVKQMMSLSAHYPSWFNFTPFLYHYLNDKYEEALVDALKIDSPNLFQGALARCVSYAQLGATDEAKQELHELLENHPQFMDQGRALLTRFLGSEVLSDKIWDVVTRVGQGV